MKMNKLFISLGAWLAGLSVAVGAYGAHGATHYMNEDQLRWIAKAARYQMYHAIALILVGLAMMHWAKQKKLLNASGWLFVAGTVFFAGSLYLMAFTGIDLGYVTPLGGIAYMAGWVALAEAARRS